MFKKLPPKIFIYATIFVQKWPWTKTKPWERLACCQKHPPLWAVLQLLLYFSVCMPADWFPSHALLCSLNDICFATTEFMNIIMLQLKNNIDVKCKEKHALDDMGTHLSALKAHLHDAAGKYLKKWQVAWHFLWAYSTKLITWLFSQNLCLALIYAVYIKMANFWLLRCMNITHIV